jgi:hypothetical protein
MNFNNLIRLRLKILILLSKYQERKIPFSLKLQRKSRNQ